jgi:glycyl-tRNA synthetase beta chain
VPDAIARCEAVRQVRPTSNFEPLSAAFKRIQNILRKAGGVEQFQGDPETSLLEAGAETELYAQARRVLEETKGSTDYEMVLRRTAELRPAVDTFFDKVLVMAEDERVRRNRLTFLAWLLRAFTRVADFSEIVVS